MTKSCPITRLAMAITVMAFALLLLSARPAAAEDSWHGIQSMEEQPKYVVLRSNEEWHRLWLSDIGQLPPGPLPHNEMAIGIFLGMRPSGGYTVEITEIEQNEDGEIHVSYKENRPRPGMGVIEMLTRPYVIQLVPFSKNDVTFAETR